MIKPGFSCVFACFLLTCFLLVPAVAKGEVFEYRHVKGTQYRIISVIKQSVFIDGILSHTSQILNRISAEITDVQDGKARISAVYQISEIMLYDSQQEIQVVSSVYQLDREYETVFERDRLGRITVEPQYYMPNVRNIPVLPGRSIRVGDRWHAEALEVHDFRDLFGIPLPYFIRFNAFYEYIGERRWKEHTYPVFAINYNIEARPDPVQGRIYPSRISGTYNQRIYWDRLAGQEKAYEGTFRIAFELSDGRRIEFRSEIQAELIEAESMDREQVISEIIEEINRLEIPDVNVRVVDEGISISLENIQFYADSDRMLPGEQEKLDRIAEILRRYPDRDIMVSGHAALAGSREYLMRLSQDRARAVADYFLSGNVRTAERIVIRGFGAERPIADNNTEEGMRRNRRVEIILLEN
jgi:outer membrane protein OmpA-like peptidoglycan-associated protein